MKVAFSAAIVAMAMLHVHDVTAQGRAGAAAQPQQPMSFFITSVGIGDGANLGGLDGADAHCARLAQAAAAATNRVWRAYLSAAAAGNQPAVNARDRIGNGPW